VKWQGIGSVFASFLIQLTVGTWVATIGNMLPYFTSYMRWRGVDVTIGDMILVQAAGGVAMGLSQMMGGLIFIPYLGLRGCLWLACCLFVSGSVLTFWSLDFGVGAVLLTYGILPAAGMNMALVPTYLLPVKWFPNHTGIIIGFIQVGFGLSSTVFIPLQTFLINPSNVPATSDDPLQYSGRPTISNSSVAPNLSNTTDMSHVKYFTDPNVLERIPWAVLYLAAIHAVVIIASLVLVTRSPPLDDNAQQEQKKEGSSRIKEAFKYLTETAFTRADYYLLFLTQGCLLVVNAGLYGQWKTLSLSVQADDQLVGLVGSLIGVFNCISRFAGGFLVDRFSFRQVMSSASFLLACVCFSIVFVARTENFLGFAVVVLAGYLFAMAHFATVPAQAIKLFGRENSSIIIGTCGAANALSYIIFSILNWFFFSRDLSTNSFLWFFLSLGVFAMLATLVAALVSEPGDKTNVQRDAREKRERKKTESASA